MRSGKEEEGKNKKRGNKKKEDGKSHSQFEKVRRNLCSETYLGPKSERVYIKRRYFSETFLDIFSSQATAQVILQLLQLQIFIFPPYQDVELIYTYIQSSLNYKRPGPPSSYFVIVIITETISTTCCI